jgi:hypothetical protein
MSDEKRVARGNGPCPECGFINGGPIPPSRPAQAGGGTDATCGVLSATQPVGSNTDESRTATPAPDAVPDEDAVDLAIGESVRARLAAGQTHMVSPDEYGDGGIVDALIVEARRGQALFQRLAHRLEHARGVIQRQRRQIQALREDNAEQRQMLGRALYDVYEVDELRVENARLRKFDLDARRRVDKAIEDMVFNRKEDV